MVHMATKAERYRYEQERSHPPERPKKKAKKRARSGWADGAAAAVSRDQANGSTGTARRNIYKRSNNTGSPALENSATGKPSRKSTRKSAEHVKLATNLTSR